MSDPKKEIKQEQEEKKEQVKKEEMKTVETWAYQLRIASWQLAALKKANNYASGKSLTKAGFETALKNAMNKKF